MKSHSKSPPLFAALREAPWWIGALIGMVAAILLHWGFPAILAGLKALVAWVMQLLEWVMIAVFIILAVELGDPKSPFRSQARRPRRFAPWMGATGVRGAAFSANTWSLPLLQSLEWKRFEEVCCKLYALRGFRSESTPLGPDGGIDIRLYEGSGPRAVAIVQCKAWGGRPVGVKPVRELLGVMAHEKVGQGFFMAAGGFTEEARQFAASNPLTLITGEMLLTMIKLLSPADQQTLLHLATAGDYRTPTCPSCGTKMRAVSGREGRPDFWGCPNYPRCRQKLGMRADRPQADLDF